MTELDFSAHYRVRGYPGIAWRIIRWDTDWLEGGWELVCENSSHFDYLDHSGHPECWIYNEGDEIENYDRVIAVMVGDDRDESLEVSELILIAETDFCRDCGQIGCSSNVYE